MKFGETLHMRLVKNRVVPGMTDTARPAFPIKIRIDHNALRHKGSAVAFIEGRVIAALHLISEKCGIPLQFTNVGARVWIEEQLIRIKPMPILRLVWAVDAVAVDRSGLHFRQIAMPDLIRIFRQRDALHFVLTLSVEEANLD